MGQGLRARQGKGPRLWCCVWGRKSPQEHGSPGDHRVFPGLGVHQQQEVLVQKSLVGASCRNLLAANKYRLS